MFWDDLENGSIIPKEDTRGQYVRDVKNESKVMEHISSYNPSPSHFRRKHAPNRLYLASDLTIVAILQYGDGFVKT